MSVMITTEMRKFIFQFEEMDVAREDDIQEFGDDTSGYSFWAQTRIPQTVGNSQW